MRKVYTSTVFDQPVDAVWAVLGDFHRVDRWSGIVHASEPENGDRAATIGSIRRLTIGDNRHTTRERLVSYDAAERRMTYELPDGPPLGMSHYLGTIHVMPITDTGRAFVEWFGQYACDNVADVPRIEAGLAGTYKAFFADLRRHLESSAGLPA